MNYIYLKTSTEPVKVGDLTTEGIVTFESESLQRFYDKGHGTIFTPLLIMHIPPLMVETYNVLNTHGRKMLLAGEEKIPFQSNEQVYNWFKKKGITPEAEGLYELDGQVQIELEPLPSNFKIRCDHCLDAGFFGNIPCKWCNYGGEFKGIPKDENHPVQLARKKVAIIKEEQEESEKKLLTEIIIKCITNHEDKISISDTVKELKQHFKIERR